MVAGERTLVIGKPTIAPEARSWSITGPTLLLERASLRVEPSSLRLIPPSLLIRSRACHPERRARLCAWRSAIVRPPRVAKDLLFVARDLLSVATDPLSVAWDLLSVGNDLLSVAKGLLSVGKDLLSVAKDLLSSYLLAQSPSAGADIG